MINNSKNSIFATFDTLLDLVVGATSFAMAFVLAVLFEAPLEMTLDSPVTLITIFFTVVVHSLVLSAFGVYSPIPFVKPGKLLFRIIRINIGFFGVLEIIAALIARESVKTFVIIWLLITFIINTALLVFKKNLHISITKMLRRKNYNLRRVIIVGDNTATAADFVRQVELHPECGMMVIGFVGDKINEGEVFCEKLGGFKDLSRIIDTYRPDDAVFAIDAYDKRHLIKLVNICDDRFVKVYFLPVIYGFFKVASQIETIGQLPVINIHHTPLDNAGNAFIKRLIDIVGSLALIILTSPIMLVAAIGVAISSPGPIIFTQERVGKMGKTFKMLKFRSMRVNVGKDEEWTTAEDPRKTRFGAFIRMTAIDELPQLFNVLIGDMSLVGPRPEIPFHVEHFREEIPLYMIKHYVKPGMTGLAQVRGLRGDTSIEERIQADIEYIENWTLPLDIIILLKTPFRAFNKAEKYQTQPEEVGGIVADLGQEQEESVATVEPDVTEACESPVTEDERGETVTPIPGRKLLYAASTMSHINNFHLEYIEALRKDGYEVKIMARGDGADFNIPFEKRMFSAENAACRKEISEILKAERFDAILLNTSLAAFHIRLCLPKLARPRVVNLVHGYLFSEDIGFVKRLALASAEKWLAPKTDAIITMNEWDRRYAESHHLASKIYFCRGLGAVARPHSVSPEKIRRELNSQESFVLAFVGELSDRKNQKFLIHAMSEIKERIPNAVLWLIGGGLEKESLTALAESVAPSSSVIFVGQRENPADFMRAANLYVSASRIEGMPFNIIEAMGCGKTVLASRIKGHTDLIEDGRTGFLYDVNDIDKFVDSVVKIYNGELSVRTDDVIAKYKEYSRDEVFCETLALIKESLGQDEQ